MKKISVIDALEAYEHISEHLSLGRFAIALLVSLAASLIAAGLYRMFYESRGTGSQISRAFPLLGLSITTLFICIQVSIPLSLGLMGSLSIIRFRTPIKEPEEVGFIILVIAASVASATYRFAFLIVLYSLAFASLLIVRKIRGLPFFQRDGLLVFNFPDATGPDMGTLQDMLKKHLRHYSIQHANQQKGSTSLQLTFAGLKTDILSLQNELRTGLSTENITVYLDRPGGIR